MLPALARSRHLDQERAGQVDRTPGSSSVICNVACGGVCGLMDAPWPFHGCRGQNEQEAGYFMLRGRIWDAWQNDAEWLKRVWDSSMVCRFSIFFNAYVSKQHVFLILKWNDIEWWCYLLPQMMVIHGVFDFIVWLRDVMNNSRIFHDDSGMY